MNSKVILSVNPFIIIIIILTFGVLKETSSSIASPESIIFFFFNVLAKRLKTQMEQNVIISNPFSSNMDLEIHLTSFRSAQTAQPS